MSTAAAAADIIVAETCETEVEDAAAASVMASIFVPILSSEGNHPLEEEKAPVESVAPVVLDRHPANGSSSSSSKTHARSLQFGYRTAQTGTS